MPKKSEPLDKIGARMPAKRDTMTLGEFNSAAKKAGKLYPVKPKMWR